MIEKSPSEAGLVDKIKASRIGQVLHRINLGRYERIVPREERELAESLGWPKPNQYAPGYEEPPLKPAEPEDRQKP